MGNGIEETRGYNSRLQPTRIQAGGLLTLWNCYQAGDDASCPSLIATPANSGEIQGQKIMRGSQSWTQKFTYDAMNRLSSALETGGWHRTMDMIRSGIVGFPAQAVCQPIP